MSQQAAVGSRVHVPGFAGAAAVARRDITPPVGVRARNWGPAETDVAEGVHRPLTLTALALRGSGSDDQPVLVFGVDGTWWRRVDDERRLRGSVLAALGLDESRLLFALSHTHAGPVLSAAVADLDGGALARAYLDRLATAAVSAGREALAGLAPAVVAWTTGRCDLARNRELDLGGRAVVGMNPASAADDAVLLGRVSAADGTTIATLVNYACHPTTLAWQNRLVSPDYVGAMRDTVETATGAPCVFLQGASGELAPGEQYTGDVEVADRHGRALGHAVLSALDGLPPAGAELELVEVVESGASLAVWRPVPSSPSGRLDVRRVDVELEVRRLPDFDELEREWAGIDERSRDERLRRARDLRDDYISGPTVTHPVWVWRLGDALLVAQPGEAYSQLQRGLRARYPGRPVVVMNLTNGPGFVYVPTGEAYQRGAYQAWQTPLAAGSLERLEDAAAATLDALVKEHG